MSLEGMWAVYFGDIDGAQVNSGIAVLETNRVFGGDSFIAYLGKYSVSGTTVEAIIETWAYNPTIEVVTAFGEVGPERTEVRLEGQHNADAENMGEIVGQVWRASNEQIKLPARLVKVAELP